MEKYIEAEKYYDKLIKTTSMDEIYDIVDSLDEEMAKLVLKKFIYARGR